MFLLVVFDGLRPDMVRADTTPNLLRLSRQGVRFAHARSVFPSETRVCSASVTTGCLPRRHGLVANAMGHPLDPARIVDTGSAAVLRAFEQEIGAGVLDVPALGERVAGFTVLSSGTTGQSFVLNPNADALGQVTLSGHGAEACSAAGRALLATLEPPPADSVGRAVWAAEVFRTRLLPSPPAATVLWLCEPDFTGHYGGLGSDAQLAALRAVDAAFGRILDDWQAGPHRDTLQMMVASDHGQSTVTARHRVALERFPDCTLIRGSSCGIVVPGAEATRIAAIAEWLTRQDWTGSVFAADIAELPPGVLARSALLADHPRAAQVLFTLRGSQAVSGRGLGGITLYDGDLATGAGTHGGILPAEMRTVLMLAGSLVRAGAVSELPAGLVDIAPTVLHLLGLPGGAGMDGRVLGEALLDGAAPDSTPAPETWEAAAVGYSQRLGRTRLGRSVYIDGGERG